jgi:hypothetical protein
MVTEQALSLRVHKGNLSVFVDDYFCAGRRLDHCAEKIASPRDTDTAIYGFFSRGIQFNLGDLWRRQGQTKIYAAATSRS